MIRNQQKLCLKFYIDKIKSNFIVIFIFSILLFTMPWLAGAAEILQVRSSSLLQIGDQNRSYTVQIGCIRIDPDKAYKAKDWLKSEFPRRTRVNLKPLTSEDGILVARVIPIGSDMEIGQKMISQGFGIDTCSNY